ncbi:barstar family protein [Dactylosporangium sp. NBC_01737]|uniref:barstar family protein n=1 Tax=Dactylosporangium sp. NBC_01737 TaxID=2975959 RepID=UPI002E152F91|nr:barstar family protein [Dactylosporangium sp. NBC_01737]
MTSNWWASHSEPLAVCSRSTVVEVAAVLPAAGRFVVARLDGVRMADVEHMFYEFSDALLFPGYFGWNWAALSDCLSDLQWLPADGYLLVVENAPEMLSSSAGDRCTLFGVLSRAVRHWANPIGRPGGEGVAFKVLLVCDRDEDVVRLRREIAACTAGDV